MNRIVLFAQLFGALVFTIAAVAIADPAQRVLVKDDVTATFFKGLVAAPLPIRVPGRIEWPNIQAKPGKQTLQLEVEWTPGLSEWAANFANGGGARSRPILLTVGSKRFRLNNALITEIGFPEMQFNPKEIGIDKYLSLKMETEVVDFREGGVNDTTHIRSFRGDFKVEIEGVDAFSVTKVNAFRAPISLMGKGSPGRQGSMTVEMTRKSPSTSWTDWNGLDPGVVNLTFLDTAKSPLLTASFKVRKSLMIGDPKTSGRSMSFELMFDSFTLGRGRPAGPRAGRGG
jgi:hypothetical protein